MISFVIFAPPVWAIVILTIARWRRFASSFAIDFEGTTFSVCDLPAAIE